MDHAGLVVRLSVDGPVARRAGDASKRFASLGIRILLGVGRRGGRCRRAGVDGPAAASARSVADPTLEAFAWRGLRDAPALRTSLPSCFRPTGRTPGRSRSRSVPPRLFSCCPATRAGWAFVAGGQKLLGGDGVLVARAADVSWRGRRRRPPSRRSGSCSSCTLARNGASRDCACARSGPWLDARAPAPLSGRAWRLEFLDVAREQSGLRRSEGEIADPFGRRPDI